MDVVLTDGAVTRALGAELRQVRDTVGWTRAELVDRLPSDIHVQTRKATYERGIRQCTVERLVEICRALGVAAPDVLGLALQRARIDLHTIGLQVDLRAVIRDRRAELRPLRRWARNRLAGDPDGRDVVRVDQAAVGEMAALVGIDRPELLTHLTTFAPTWRATPTAGA